MGDIGKTRKGRINDPSEFSNLSRLIITYTDDLDQARVTRDYTRYGTLDEFLKQCCEEERKQLAALEKRGAYYSDGTPLRLPDPSEPSVLADFWERKQLGWSEVEVIEHAANTTNGN